MLVWALPQAALAPVAGLNGVVGRKPPWKKPHAMCCALSRSPMLGPLIATVVPAEQSSMLGSGSPITVPLTTELVGALGVAPWVWPETRLRAPGVEGPKTVL